MHLKPLHLLPLLTITLAAPTPYHPDLPPAGSLVATTRYIVQLSPNTSLTTHALRLNTLCARSTLRNLKSIDPSNRTLVSPDSISTGSTIDRSFRISSFQGYVGTFNHDEAAEIAAMDEVMGIEPDLIYTLATIPEHVTSSSGRSGLRKRATTTTGPGSATNENSTADATPFVIPPSIPLNSNILEQPKAPWHLPDISHLSANQTSYLFPASAGAGTRVYILDSGIRRTHRDFGDRVEWGYNGLTGSMEDPGEQADTNGHGTHVAGLVGGSTYGVAKGATLIDVKVFDYSTTSMSAILSGLEWSVSDILTRNATLNSIINLSLSSPIPPTSSSTVLECAITAATTHDLLITIAAGNSDTPATASSPSRAPGALTIGMTDSSRERASFIPGMWGSNYGEGVALYAPGANVVSASFKSDSGSLVMSGTSMAAPIVAGMAAVVMAEGDAVGSEAVKKKLLEMGQKGVITDSEEAATVNGTEILAYNGIGK